MFNTRGEWVGPTGTPTPGWSTGPVPAVVASPSRRRRIARATGRELVDALGRVVPRGYGGYDRNGHWHDPSTGRYARPGYSSAKRLSLLATRSPRVREHAKNNREGVMLVARDNYMSRIGLTKGTKVRVFYLNDEYGVVKERLRDYTGHEIGYLVRWDRFVNDPDAHLRTSRMGMHGTRRGNNTRRTRGDGWETALRAETSGTRQTQAVLADNYLKRFGYKKGDVVTVTYIDEERGGIFTPDGVYRRVGWARFEDRRPTADEIRHAHENPPGVPPPRPPRRAPRPVGWDHGRAGEGLVVPRGSRSRPPSHSLHTPLVNEDDLSPVDGGADLPDAERIENIQRAAREAEVPDLVSSGAASTLSPDASRSFAEAPDAGTATRGPDFDSPEERAAFVEAFGEPAAADAPAWARREDEIAAERDAADAAARDELMRTAGFDPASHVARPSGALSEEQATREAVADAGYDPDEVTTTPVGSILDEYGDEWTVLRVTPTGEEVPPEGTTTDPLRRTPEGDPEMGRLLDDMERALAEPERPPTTVADRPTPTMDPAITEAADEAADGADAEPPTPTIGDLLREAESPSPFLPVLWDDSGTAGEAVGRLAEPGATMAVRLDESDNARFWAARGEIVDAGATFDADNGRYTVPLSAAGRVPWDVATVDGVSSSTPGDVGSAVMDASELPDGTVVVPLSNMGRAAAEAAATVRGGEAFDAAGALVRGPFAVVARAAREGDDESLLGEIVEEAAEEVADETVEAGRESLRDTVEGFGDVADVAPEAISQTAEEPLETAVDVSDVDAEDARQAEETLAPDPSGSMIRVRGDGAVSAEAATARVDLLPPGSSVSLGGGTAPFRRGTDGLWRTRADGDGITSADLVGRGDRVLVSENPRDAGFRFNEGTGGSAFFTASWEPDVGSWMVTRTSRDPGGGVESREVMLPDGADPRAVVNTAAAEAGWGPVGDQVDGFGRPIGPVATTPTPAPSVGDRIRRGDGSRLDALPAGSTLSVEGSSTKATKGEDGTWRVPGTHADDRPGLSSDEIIDFSAADWSVESVGPTPPTTEAAPDTPEARRSAAVEAIGVRELGLETLETRGRDSLDFHEVGVTSLRDALDDAWRAGWRDAGGTIDPAPDPDRLSEIATSSITGLETLETRGRDSLDFPEAAVWELKDALGRAYDAGAAQWATAGSAEVPPPATPTAPEGVPAVGDIIEGSRADRTDLLDRLPNGSKVTPMFSTRPGTPITRGEDGRWRTLPDSVGTTSAVISQFDRLRVDEVGDTFDSTPRPLRPGDRISSPDAEDSARLVDTLPVGSTVIPIYPLGDGDPLTRGEDGLWRGDPSERGSTSLDVTATALRVGEIGTGGDPASTIVSGPPFVGEVLMGGRDSERSARLDSLPAGSQVTPLHRTGRGTPITRGEDGLWRTGPDSAGTSSDRIVGVFPRLEVTALGETPAAPETPAVPVPEVGTELRSIGDAAAVEVPSAPAVGDRISADSAGLRGPDPDAVARLNELPVGTRISRWAGDTRRNTEWEKQSDGLWAPVGGSRDDEGWTSTESITSGIDSIVIEGLPDAAATPSGTDVPEVGTVIPRGDGQSARIDALPVGSRIESPRGLSERFPDGNWRQVGADPDASPGLASSEMPQFVDDAVTVRRVGPATSDTSPAPGTPEAAPESATPDLGVSDGRITGTARERREALAAMPDGTRLRATLEGTTEIATAVREDGGWRVTIPLSRRPSRRMTDAEMGESEFPWEVDTSPPPTADPPDPDTAVGREFDFAAEGADFEAVGAALDALPPSTQVDSADGAYVAVRRAIPIDGEDRIAGWDVFRRGSDTPWIEDIPTDELITFDSDNPGIMTWTITSDPVTGTTLPHTPPASAEPSGRPVANPDNPASYDAFPAGATLRRVTGEPATDTDPDVATRLPDGRWRYTPSGASDDDSEILTAVEMAEVSGTWEVVSDGAPGDTDGGDATAPSWAGLASRQASAQALGDELVRVKVAPPPGASREEFMGIKDSIKEALRSRGLRPADHYDRVTKEWTVPAELLLDPDSGIKMDGIRPITDRMVRQDNIPEGATVLPVEADGDAVSDALTFANGEFVDANGDVVERGDGWFVVLDRPQTPAAPPSSSGAPRMGEDQWQALERGDRAALRAWFAANIPADAKTWDWGYALDVLGPKPTDSTRAREWEIAATELKQWGSIRLRGDRDLRWMPAFIAQKQRDGWTEADKDRVFKAMFEHDLGDGYRSVVTRISGSGGSFVILGKVVDARGNQKGNFERNVDFTGGGVYHALFKMKSSAKGGVATDFIALTQDAYEKSGFINTVTVSAAAGGGYNGGYTWGRLGFRFSGSSYALAAYDAFMARDHLLDDDAKADLAAIKARLDRYRFGDPQYPDANDFAMVGWRPGKSGDHAGKTIMSNHVGWGGKKDVYRLPGTDALIAEAPPAPPPPPPPPPPGIGTRIRERAQFDALPVGTVLRGSPGSHGPGTATRTHAGWTTRYESGLSYNIGAGDLSLNVWTVDSIPGVTGTGRRSGVTPPRPPRVGFESRVTSSRTRFNHLPPGSTIESNSSRYGRLVATRTRTGWKVEAPDDPDRLPSWARSTTWRGLRGGTWTVTSVAPPAVNTVIYFNGNRVPWTLSSLPTGTVLRGPDGITATRRADGRWVLSTGGVRSNSGMSGTEWTVVDVPGGPPEGESTGGEGGATPGGGAGGGV